MRKTLLFAIVISGLLASCGKNKDIKSAFNDYINLNANNPKSVELVDISQVDTFKTSTLKDPLLDSCKVLDKQFEILDKIKDIPNALEKRGWKLNSKMRKYALYMVANDFPWTSMGERLTYKYSLHNFEKIPDVSMIRYTIKYREDENGNLKLKEICAYKDIKSDSVFIAKTPYDINSSTVKRIKQVKDTFMKEYTPLRTVMNNYEWFWDQFNSYCLVENGGTL